MLLQHVADTLTTTRSEVAGVRRSSMLNSILTVLTIIVVLLTVSVIVDVRRDIDSNQDVVAAVQVVVDRIQSCTEPGHSCYDTNQQRSDQRLGPIVSALCEAVPIERRRPPCPPTIVR
jgi:hypothetical protein